MEDTQAYSTVYRLIIMIIVASARANSLREGAVRGKFNRFSLKPNCVHSLYQHYCSFIIMSKKRCITTSIQYTVLMMLEEVASTESV